MTKPMLSAKELVLHMQKKGITFSIMNADEVQKYLCKSNNYFKLSAYRKNYAKHITKENKEVYEHLDFIYLVELARLDVQLRHVLLGMCLDIEHALKVEIIKAIEEDTTQDGYTIVSDFDSVYNILEKKIGQNQRNPYCGDLIEKHKQDMPIWAFVEILAFGDLLRLIDFIQDKIDFSLPIEIKSLNRVRKIRNASAHNNCLINDLKPVFKNGSGKPDWRESKYITDFMTEAGVNKNAMHKKLSNQRFSQIVHLLYVYSTLVQNGHTRSFRMKELETLISIRMKEHKDYFNDNEILVTTYNVFKTLVEKHCL